MQGESIGEDGKPRQPNISSEEYKITRISDEYYFWFFCL
jgi:hypothetical protein